MTVAVAVERALDGWSAEVWDGLMTPDDGGTPFMRHAFLASLADSRAVGKGSGWDPYYLVARDDGGRVVGATAAYVKTHSMGEFVYDWAWADAAQRAGISYYPKLVVAVPFSPVSGRRLLVAPDWVGAARRVVQAALIGRAVELGRELGCTGVHVLFPLEDEVEVARELGFCHRVGAQFHWENEGYPDFEAFLARFDSKRRNQIRRERRKVRAAGVEIRSYVGDEVRDEFLRPAFALYGVTVDRYVWGRRYLSSRFFELLWARMRRDLQLTLAFRDGRIVGGAVNLQAGRRRWGRYWGALEEIDSLHFEVCAYQPIEDCIRQGILRFEAGAGGEHKIERGFLPALTHSAHLFFEPRFHDVLADFCEREAAAVKAQVEAAREGFFVR